MTGHHWKSAITKVEPNRILFRGYRIDELMGELNYAEAVYLALKGELPGEAEGKMIDAILVSTIDHGVTPQSTLASLNAASAGSPLNASVAAGVLAISTYHGGAIEAAMRFLLEAREKAQKKGISAKEAAAEIVDEYRNAKKRISGYGHLIHSRDPRTVKLYALADDLDMAGPFVEMANAVEDVLGERSGKKLPTNINGATAAVLLEMGFDPELANAFFIIARLPGLVAHIREEVVRQRPLRTINPSDAEYDGPPERDLP
jgi:citrate synthase